MGVISNVMHGTKSLQIAQCIKFSQTQVEGWYRWSLNWLRSSAVVYVSCFLPGSKVSQSPFGALVCVRRNYAFRKNGQLLVVNKRREAFAASTTAEEGGAGTTSNGHCTQSTSSGLGLSGRCGSFVESRTGVYARTFQGKSQNKDKPFLFANARTISLLWSKGCNCDTQTT